jgi:hypothetical protein
VIWSGNSIKQARGQVKQNINSLKENMEKHNWSDGQRFEANDGLLQYWDDEGVWFEQTFRIREI